MNYRINMNGQLSTPPLVLNLIIINALVFLAQVALPHNISLWMDQHMGLYTWISPLFRPHQLVTGMFMHGSFSHLFFNMFALWMFGRTLEYDLGAKRFLTYYMVCGIGAGLLNQLANWVEISNMMQQAYAVTAEGQALINYRINIPTIGASGAVFGILLAFGMLHPNATIILLIPPIPMKAKYFVIIYGVIELFLGVSGHMDGIAHFAHVGGMLWGFILLKFWKTRGKIFY